MMRPPPVFGLELLLGITPQGDRSEALFWSANFPVPIGLHYQDNSAATIEVFHESYQSDRQHPGGDP